MIGGQSKEIAQLKKYIGETDNLPKPSELARKENASLMAKLKVQHIIKYLCVDYFWHVFFSGYELQLLKSMC